MRLRTLRTALGGAGALCVALVGCTNHDYYGQANVSEQDGDAMLDVNVGVWIQEGYAASAHIDLVGVGGTDYAGDIVSMNPEVLGIFHTPGDPGKYVFLGTSSTAIGYGGRPGYAEVVISIDGVPVRTTMAVVEPPPGEDAGLDASSDAEVGDGGIAEAGEQDAGETDAADAD